MMPTASAPSAAIARSTRLRSPASASLPSPSRASAGSCTSRSSRLQARPPPSRGKSREATPGVPCGTRNRQSLPGLPGHHRRRAETMICPAALAVEHRGLVAVEAPAVRRLLRRGRNVWPDRSAPAVPNARMPDTANRPRPSAAAPASAPQCRIPRSAMRRSRPLRDKARRRGRARTLPSGCRSRSRRRRARHGPPRSAAPASRDRRIASRYRR